MNETQFEEAIKATAIELGSMSREELRREVEKRENCDFARIFAETGEASDEDFGYYPASVNQRHLILSLSEEKLEELINQAVAKQLKLFLPTLVDNILSKLEDAKI
ncbi:MAG: hypothetical protein DRR16_06310 [Candidatus Parabeggiatoa sp. nov. 3]|nr:MAG: hypothetical protein DRR00_23600 [Gammaproteobacteria bacterium]RKZ62613.1 MAG: hypothetical protein DRQ99_18450 [Gammaproteobacteria bacterium]RKZ87855.1 MAG: hypothetical protein DRR16_06310 [Gammaproteobacteria bacterium]HEW97325.1 hypothetical protein [Beggiatoa sp.]